MCFNICGVLLWAPNTPAFSKWLTYLSSIDSSLAAALTEAWGLGILKERSLHAVLENLQKGTFSSEHYVKLYQDRAWLARHPEQASALEAAAKEEKQQQQAAAAEVLRALKTPTSHLSRPAASDPAIMSANIGRSGFALHASQLIVYRAPRYLRRFPLPYSMYRITQSLPHRTLQAENVHVFTSTVEIHWHTYGGANEEGAAHIKDERIHRPRVLGSQTELADRLPGDTRWNVFVNNLTHESSSYTHYFVGIQLAGGGRVVELSSRFTVSKQAAACFAAEEDLFAIS